MNEKYHQKKIQEEREAAAIKSAATIDYNIMMGNLEDPEQEANDAQ